MAVDIKKLFDEELPAALAKNAAEAKTIGAKYQMNITGPTGGDWNVDVSDSGPSCKPGTGPADCTISITDEDFQKLVENPQANGMQLFFSGKLKVSGNQMLAMKLQKLFGFRRARAVRARLPFTAPSRASRSSISAGSCRAPSRHSYSAISAPRSTRSKTSAPETTCA